jgi:hypothetical protein
MLSLTNTIKTSIITEAKDIQKSKAQLPFVMKELGKRYDGECEKSYEPRYIRIHFGFYGSKWIKLDERETIELGEHKYNPDEICYAIGVSVKCDASKKIKEPKKGEVFKIKDLNIKYAEMTEYDNIPESKFLNFIIYTDPMVEELPPELDKLNKILGNFDSINTDNTDAIGQSLAPGDIVLFIPTQTKFKTKAWLEIGVVKAIKNMVTIYTRSRQTGGMWSKNESNTMNCWPGQCIKLTKDMEKLLGI